MTEANQAVSTFATLTITAMRVQVSYANTADKIDILLRTANDAYYLAIGTIGEATPELTVAWDAFRTARRAQVEAVYS